MKDAKAIFKKYCQTRKMRFTPERGVIIDAIYKTKSHFDVDKLFLQIRNENPEIRLAKGSIYRTIPCLIDAGLIRESLVDGGRVCYEPTLGYKHHDHLKCLSCGKIFEFYEEDIDKKQEDICGRRKFHMVSHLHIIWGYCSQCRKTIPDGNKK